MISYETGCRFFEISLPFDLSEKGKVINSNFFENFASFEFNIKEKKTLQNLEKIDFSEYELDLLDLNDKIFETDTKVLKENCKCFTCKSNYTRAYIHHLLKCHELNANILITL
jgi:queuine tRNA-ribosyltransferase subunit QTRTD1